MGARPACASGHRIVRPSTGLRKGCHAADGQRGTLRAPEYLPERSEALARSPFILTHRPAQNGLYFQLRGRPHEARCSPCLTCLPGIATVNPSGAPAPSQTFGRSGPGAGASVHSAAPFSTDRRQTARLAAPRPRATARYFPSVFGLVSVIHRKIRGKCGDGPRDDPDIDGSVYAPAWPCMGFIGSTVSELVVFQWLVSGNAAPRKT
jgi:hypothetical protein